MKKLRKLLLYTYRTLIILALSTATITLLARLFFFIMKKIALIYPPYTAWLVYILFFAAGIWAILSEVKSQRETKKQQAVWEAQASVDFTEEFYNIVERCLSQYPYEIQLKDYYYTIVLAKGRHIDIRVEPVFIEMQIHLDGYEENSYYADTPEDLPDLEREFSADLYKWLTDQWVLISFVSDDEKYLSYRSSALEDIDTVIKEQLHPPADPIWFRILSCILLFSNKEPPVAKICVTSANSTLDRIISP